MGLFEKKYCDICGEKIGLLGNRKLEDGNICSKCAGKLSPFFTGRKKSTLNDIKEQLAYREQNKERSLTASRTRSACPPSIRLSLTVTAPRSTSISRTAALS